MEFAFGGFGDPLFSAAVQQLMDLPEELERQLNPPTRAYVRDRKAMANTPMDVKELPSGALVLAVDMPGVSPAEVRVQVEDGNVLTISGERKRPADDDGGKAAGADGNKQGADGGGVRYLRMERRMGKFMRRFPLPENADLNSIRAEHRDGVLTVTVQKLPPPEPKKPRVVEVKVGGGEHGSTGGDATDVRITDGGKGNAGAGQQQGK